MSIDPTEASRAYSAAHGPAPEAKASNIVPLNPEVAKAVCSASQAPAREETKQKTTGSAARRRLFEAERRRREEERPAEPSKAELRRKFFANSESWLAPRKAGNSGE